MSSGRDVASAYDAMAETYDAIDDQPFYAVQYATFREDLLHAANALVIVADATALPFRGRAFDGAASYGEPLSHMADPGAALGELARVVRASARVALSVDNQWNLRTLLHPRQLVAALRSRGGAIRPWEYFDDGGCRVRL
ncbi:MAG: methyltransferase domain-containing protein, partial [Gemmatimonadota bacterium]